MLTGKSYGEIAGMIDWGVQKNHYTTWKELRGVLSALGWQADELYSAKSWGDISGLAIVHVEGDHFILYDAEDGAFYDPGLLDGPNVNSDRIPVSYLRVQRPRNARASNVHDRRVARGCSGD